MFIYYTLIFRRQLPVACTRTTTPLEKATRIVINTTGKCQVITVKVVSHIFPDLLTWEGLFVANYIVVRTVK